MALEQELPQAVDLADGEALRPFGQLFAFFGGGCIGFTARNLRERDAVREIHQRTHQR